MLWQLFLQQVVSPLTASRRDVPSMVTVFRKLFSDSRHEVSGISMAPLTPKRRIVHPWPLLLKPDVQWIPIGLSIIVVASLYKRQLRPVCICCNVPKRALVLCLCFSLFPQNCNALARKLKASSLQYQISLLKHHWHTNSRNRTQKHGPNFTQGSVMIPTGGCFKPTQHSSEAEGAMAHQSAVVFGETLM